jgi:hypothetical protein
MDNGQNKKCAKKWDKDSHEMTDSYCKNWPSISLVKLCVVLSKTNYEKPWLTVSDDLRLILARTFRPFRITCQAVYFSR